MRLIKKKLLAAIITIVMVLAASCAAVFAASGSGDFQVATTGVTSSSISLSWGEFAPGATYAVLLNGSVNSSTSNLNATLTGLTPNTNYTIIVIAQDSGGNSGVSNTLSVTTSGGLAGLSIVLAIPPNQASSVFSPVFAITNTSGSPLFVRVYLACYNSVGQLLGISATTQTLPSQTASSVLTPSMTKLPGTSVCKVFLWDVNYVPICGVFTFAGGTAADLPAPTDLTAVSTTDTTVTLSWKPSSYAGGYAVEINGTVIDAGKSTSIVVTGLSPHTTYAPIVRAYAGTQTSAWSDPISVTTNYAAPTGLQVTGQTSDSVSLIWNAVAAADGYILNVNGTMINVGNVNSYTILGLTSNTQFTIKIQAVFGAGSSVWSAPVTAKTSPAPVGVPGNLTQTAATTTSVSLSWSAVSGADGYDVSINGTVVTLGNVTSATIPGLTPDTNYPVEVRARRAGAVSDWSAAITASTSPEPLGIPANLTQTANTTTSVSISWSAVSGADSYDVSIDGTVVTPGPGNTTSITIPSLTPGTSYNVQVGALRGGVAGGWSAVLTATTLTLSEWATESITLPCKAGKDYYVAVTTDNIANFSTMSVIVGYSSDQLTLDDPNAHVYPGDDTSLTVDYNGPGALIFMVNREVDNNNLWDGVVTVLKFSALTDGDSDVIVNFSEPIDGLAAMSNMPNEQNGQTGAVDKISGGANNTTQSAQNDPAATSSESDAWWLTISPEDAQVMLDWWHSQSDEDKAQMESFTDFWSGFSQFLAIYDNQ